MAKKASYLEDQIRKAIKKSGITGSKLAEISGVSQGAVSRFINGKRNVTLPTASKLVKALGLELKPKKDR